MIIIYLNGLNIICPSSWSEIVFHYVFETDTYFIVIRRVKVLNYPSPNSHNKRDLNKNIYSKVPILEKKTN